MYEVDGLLLHFIFAIFNLYELDTNPLNILIFELETIDF